MIMVLTAHCIEKCGCSFLGSRPDYNSCLTEEHLLSSENEEVQQLKYYLFSSSDPCHGWQARSRTTYFKIFLIVSSYRYYILCVALLKCFKVRINCNNLSVISIYNDHGFHEYENFVFLSIILRFLRISQLYRV